MLDVMVPLCLDMEATGSLSVLCMHKQQFNYDANQALCMVATSQLLALVLVCLVTSIIL